MKFWDWITGSEKRRREEAERKSLNDQMWEKFKADHERRAKERERHKIIVEKPQAYVSKTPEPLPYTSSSTDDISLPMMLTTAAIMNGSLTSSDDSSKFSDSGSSSSYDGGGGDFSGGGSSGSWGKGQLVAVRRCIDIEC